MRVAFLLNIQDRNWLGGVNYFRNLFDSLRLASNHTIHPVIISGREFQTDIYDTRDLPEIHYTNWAIPASARWMLRRAVTISVGRDYVLERILDRLNVDLFSHISFLGKRSKIPSLSWIPDFQEQYLPDFFSRTEIEQRNRNNSRVIRGASSILLSSEHAREGLASLSKEAADRAQVLPFVSSVPPIANLPTRLDLESKYGPLPQYFFLPNQFWAHKNHELVIAALHRLKQSGRPITVLATGNLNDYRQPLHGKKLVDLIATAGLQREFRILGIVPYSDLMAFMVHAVAVINPSLFEGWSTTVEEAKSLGKQILLSDIPVHREQSPEWSGYFLPHDKNQLADLLVYFNETYSPEEDIRRMAEAEKRLPARRTDFAGRYAAIVRAVVGGHT